MAGPIVEEDVAETGWTDAMDADGRSEAPKVGLIYGAAGRKRASVVRRTGTEASKCIRVAIFDRDMAGDSGDPGQTDRQRDGQTM